MKSNHRLQRPHIFVIWAALFIFTCLPFCSAQWQKHTEISKFPFQEVPLFPSFESRFYRLDLANAPKDLDLLISVLPAWGSSESPIPKLFISYNKEFPQKMNDADYSSISTSGNVVLISNKDFKDISKTLYIGLICGEAWCQTEVSIEWTKEMKAIANGEKAIENFGSVNEANSAVVRLTIPKEDDLERIVIHVDSIIPLKERFPSSWRVFVEVFVGQGTSLPFTNKAENIPRTGWRFEGNTMIIDKDSSLFCNDCVLTLSLKLRQSSAFSIQGETFKKNTKISGEVMLDAVQKGKENFYRLAGRESHKGKDFILSVKVQQGKVNVLVNCDTQPQSSADYSWSYLAENSTEIILPRCSTENYFFVVSGEESSVYSLQASYTQSNQLFMGSQRETAPMNDEILPEEKVTFEVLVPTFSAEEISLNFHFSQTLEIDIINCKFATDCPGLIPTKKNNGQLTNHYGFDDLPIDGKVNYKSEEIPEKGLAVKINPKESGCYPILITEKALPICAYLVTLSNKQSSVIGYSLATEFKGPNLLEIGESKFDIVAKNQSLYYALYIPHSANIDSIQIQLTEFSGDLDIFVSRSNKYPDKEENSIGVKFSHEGLIVLEVLPDPSGAYYIGVHGQEISSSFSLSAIVGLKPVDPNRHRRWDNPVIETNYFTIEDSAWTLTPGKPQKGVLLPKNQYEAQYYKILLDQKEDWEGTLRITVNSLRGRVLILANNNGDFPIADKNKWSDENDDRWGELRPSKAKPKNMWNDKDNDLEISSSDPNFKRKGVYYIGIIFDRSAPDARLLADLAYHITYSLVDDLPEPIHTFLSPNTPFYGGLKRDKSEHFEATLLADQAPLTIYKYSESGEIDIYVSTDSGSKYPNQDSYSFTTKDQNKDFITVKSCENAEALFCSVYITVVSTGGHKEVSYSLSMKYDMSSQKSSSPVALVDGRKIQSITPRNNFPAMFYYYAVPSQNSLVTVSCPGKEIVIYAKRMKVDIKSLDEPDIEALSKITAEFTSAPGDTYISVPPLADSDVTIVAVSVYFKDTEEHEATFRILASTQIIQLSTGAPYSGFIAKDHYVYFMLNIMRPDCTLLISLTNLEEGDADLVISHGAHPRPTTTEHQFAYLSDKRTEIIEINNTDISPLRSMSGSWVIGVYGDTSSSFSLSVVYEDQKMVGLKTGVPVEMSLEESSFVYFKYLHEFEKNLEINFNQISGQLNLYITSIDMNQDFVVNIPDQAHHKWRVSGQSVISIPMQNQRACVSCVYIMNIEAVSSSKFTLAVNQLDDILPIQNRLQYEGQLRSQKSTVYLFKLSKENHELQLNIEMRGKKTKMMVFGSHSPVLNLTNYLWKRNITTKEPNRNIPLNKLTKEDSYYIILYNPTKRDLDYSFSINPKAKKFDRVEQIYDLNPNEKILFEYISDGSSTTYEMNTQDGSSFGYHPSFIDIIFYAIQKKGENKQKPMKEYLKQGQTYQLEPLPRRSLEDSGLTFSAKEAPQVKSNNSHAIVQQRFSGKIPEGKGKSLIEISNPWEFKVSFRLYVGTSYNSRVIRSKKENYEGDFGSPAVGVGSNDQGKWYLWAYSCDVPMDIKVENGDPETGMATIPKGGSYLYKEEGGESSTVLVRPNANYLGRQGKYYIYSSLFDEKKFKEFDVNPFTAAHNMEHVNRERVKKEGLEIKLSQQKSQEEEKKSQVTVQFKPTEFRDAESNDEVIYQVQLCSERSQHFKENQLCWKDWGCVDSEVKLPAKQWKWITVDFQGVEDGKYSAKVKATFVHQSQPVKFAHPYVMSYINVNYLVGDEVKPMFWNVIFGIAALAVIVGFIAFRKLKTYKENKGVELQKAKISQEEYNPLDDDGVGEGIKNEEIQQENEQS